MTSSIYCATTVSIHWLRWLATDSRCQRWSASSPLYWASRGRYHHRGPRVDQNNPQSGFESALRQSCGYLVCLARSVSLAPLPNSSQITKLLVVALWMALVTWFKSIMNADSPAVAYFERKYDDVGIHLRACVSMERFMNWNNGRGSVYTEHILLRHQGRPRGGTVPYQPREGTLNAGGGYLGWVDLVWY